MITRDRLHQHGRLGAVVVNEHRVESITYELVCERCTWVGSAFDSARDAIQAAAEHQQEVHP